MPSAISETLPTFEVESVGVASVLFETCLSHVHAEKRST